LRSEDSLCSCPLVAAGATSYFVWLAARPDHPDPEVPRSLVLVCSRPPGTLSCSIVATWHGGKSGLAGGQPAGWPASNPTDGRASGPLAGGLESRPAGSRRKSVDRPSRGRCGKSSSRKQAHGRARERARGLARQRAVWQVGQRGCNRAIGKRPGAEGPAS
jgi:hypothetical protein